WTRQSARCKSCSLTTRVADPSSKNSIRSEPRAGAMQREVVRTAAALVIGNELLSGKTQDENLGPLSKTLRSLGVRLCRAVVVEDDLETIAAEVLALHRAFDVVFTSGGVGPTHDDVTIDAVARA